MAIFCLIIYKKCPIVKSWWTRYFVFFIFGRWIDFWYLSQIIGILNGYFCVILHASLNLSVNEYLFSFPEEEERRTIIERHVKIVQESFQNTIKKKIVHTSNYCMDAVILEDGSLYFIEINSFGKEYAAGSALFHWLLDEDKVYSDGNTIYFRYPA